MKAQTKLKQCNERIKKIVESFGKAVIVLEQRFISAQEAMMVFSKLASKHNHKNFGPLKHRGKGKVRKWNS